MAIAQMHPGGDSSPGYRASDGRIDLNLPVEAGLMIHSTGPIVVKVIVNLIVKTAVSRFELIGALVGGGEEMSFIDFTPGSAQLNRAETNKLHKLMRALEKRPVLDLEIEVQSNGLERPSLALIAEMRQSEFSSFETSRH